MDGRLKTTGDLVETIRFRQRHPARNEAVAPLLNKIRPFLLRPQLRTMLGQASPRFAIRDVFIKRRILLVDCSKGTLGSEVSALLARLAAGPTRSYAGAKRQLNAWLYKGMEEQLELEARMQGEMAESDDFMEGAMSFLQKRSPAFTGR